MRKLTYIIIGLLCCSMNAQENPTLLINSRVTHMDATPLYKATVQLGTGYSSLPSEVMTLESIKARYRNELKKVGFAFNVLEENANGFGYETLGQKTEGAVYEYKTSSLKEMRKFMQVRPLGVESIHVVCEIKIDEKEVRELVKTAIDQARGKAAAIAAAMGKKLGRIVHLEDSANPWSDTLENNVYYDRPANEYKYSLAITFEITNP